MTSPNTPTMSPKEKNPEEWTDSEEGLRPEDESWEDKILKALQQPVKK